MSWVKKPDLQHLDKTNSVQFWLVWPHLLHKSDPLRATSMLIILENQKYGPRPNQYSLSDQCCSDPMYSRPKLEVDQFFQYFLVIVK